MAESHVEQQPLRGLFPFFSTEVAVNSQHQPGDVVKNYRIVRTLGRGGAATTYEAQEIDTGKAVALKVLELRGLDDWKKLELFEREATTLKALNHPSIPRYVDSFQVEEDGPKFYLIQELAPGRSLAEIIAGGFHPDEAEVRRIAEQLLRILRYLESRVPPVVHRDIKPHNVIRSDTGEIYLVDFGAVNDVRRQGEGSTVVGTYGYMAPEQLRGQATTAGDLYGLGATLVYLLTRRSPAELPQKKLKIDISAHARISRDFAKWLDKLLEPAPEDRFATAREATIALERGITSVSKVGMQRIPVIVALVLILVAGAGMLAWRSGRIKAPSSSPSSTGAAQQESGVRPVRTLKGHWSAVFSVAFAPDGKTLATGSNDKTVKLWDAETGQPIRDLPMTGARVASVVFTRDGTSLLGASGPNILVWDANAGTLSRTITGHEKPVQALALDQTGELLISASHDGTVRTWNWRTGEPRQTMRHGGRVFAVAVSTNGKTMVSGGDDGNIKIWDLSAGTELHSMAHGAAVNGLAFAPDGLTFMSAGDDRTAKVWISDPGTLARTLVGHTDEVWSVVIRPDGRSAATGGKDGSIRIWDLYSGKEMRHFQADRMGVLSMSQSSTSALLASGGGTGIVNLWTLEESERDVDVEERSGWTPLHVAAYDGNLDAVKAELAKGISVDVRNAMRRTPLYNAAKRGHLVIATHLIEQGADVNAIADQGFTPMYVAAQNGHRDIVDLLITKGVDLKHKSFFDQTYLYKAAEGGHVEVAKALITKGANVNDADKWHWSPLSIASRNGHARMVELLLAQPGIDLSSAVDKTGRTPLLLAVAAGHEDIVRQLLEKGVDVNARTKADETALSVAELSKRPKIAALLREKGAK